MFGTKVLADAMDHARAEHPRESCGLVVSGVYVPRLNTAADPERDFVISRQGYAAAMRRGQLQAVIHSHPDGTDHPSHDDMAHQKASALPWCIIPHGKKPFWFGDQCPIPRLRGRVFRHGVTDCYSVIRDWYRLVKKVELLDLPRRDKWWDKGDDVYMANFSAAGFTKIDLQEARREDVLLARIKAPVYNHAALYLGQGLILHHLYNRLSVREPLARWQHFFTIAMRYTG